MKQNNSLNIQELQKFNQLLKKINIKKYSLYLVIFSGLILGNYFFSIKIYGGHEFFTNWASARLLFLQRINPYSQEAIKLLSVSAKELSILPSRDNFQFIAPLYSLYLYLPFGLIQNFNLSRAIWMTIMELVTLLSSYLIFNIFKWKPEKTIKNIFYCFSLLFFYVVTNLINGSNLILLNFLFILSLKWILDGKYINAGIVLALLTINIQIFIIPLIAICIYFISKKAWGVPLWFLITVFLLSLMASLILPDWPILLLRVVLRNPILANIGLPGVIINQWLKETLPWLWNGLALLMFGLLFYELLFYTNENDRYLWKICLVLVLNPLIWMRADLDNMITLLLPFGLVFSQWLIRDKRAGSILMIIFCTIFSFGLIGLSFLTRSILFIKPYPFFFYLFPVIVLLINLYWIRWWMKSNIPG